MTDESADFAKFQKDRDNYHATVRLTAGTGYSGDAHIEASYEKMKASHGALTPPERERAGPLPSLQRCSWEGTGGFLTAFSNIVRHIRDND